MIVRGLSVALVVVISLSAAHGEPVAPATTQPSTQPSTMPAGGDEVAALVGRLSADEWTERQAAEDRLVALGDSAAGELRRSLQTATDPDVRARLETILATIDRERTLGATRITLNVTDASPAEAFGRINEQTGGKLKPWPDDLWNRDKLPTASFAFDREPFWVVMREVCRKYGMGVQEMGGEDQLTIGQGTRRELDAPHVIHGPFMIVATQISQHRTIDLAQPNQPNLSAMMHLRVLAEPKLRIASYSYMPMMERVADEQGRSLIQGTAVHHGSTGGGVRGVWSMHVPLDGAAVQQAERIAVARGKIQVDVRTAAQSLEVDDVLQVKESTHTVGGLRVTFHEMTETNGTYGLKLSLARPQDGRTARFDWVRDVRILDAAGKPLSRTGHSGYGGDETYHYTLNFHRGTGDEPPGPPAKLVWDVPTEVKSIDVPFEFRDLPLP